MSARRRVLFGKKDDWEPYIRANLDTERYDCLFADFREADFRNFDLIAPLTLNDYPVLDERAAAARGRALYPPAAVVALCHDKLRFNQVMGAGPFAWTIPPLLDEAPPAFPFIIKRREDEFGAHAHLVADGDDLIRLQPLLGDAKFFAQTYVVGDRELATHLLIKDGIIQYHSNVVYEMGASMYVKNRQFRQKKLLTNHDDSQNALFSAILGRLGYRDGTCCFNYKLSSGTVQIFEINSRFGGSLNQDINAYLRAYERAV